MCLEHAEKNDLYLVSVAPAYQNLPMDMEYHACMGTVPTAYRRRIFSGVATKEPRMHAANYLQKTMAIVRRKKL